MANTLTVTALDLLNQPGPPNGFGGKYFWSFADFTNHYAPTAGTILDLSRIKAQPGWEGKTANWDTAVTSNKISLSNTVGTALTVSLSSSATSPQFVSTSAISTAIGDLKFNYNLKQDFSGAIANAAVDPIGTSKTTTMINNVAIDYSDNKGNSIANDDLFSKATDNTFATFTGVVTGKNLVRSEGSGTSNIYSAFSGNGYSSELNSSTKWDNTVDFDTTTAVPVTKIIASKSLITINNFKFINDKKGYVFNFSGTDSIDFVAGTETITIASATLTTGGYTQETKFAPVTTLPIPKISSLMEQPSSAPIGVNGYGTVDDILNSIENVLFPSVGKSDKIISITTPNGATIAIDGGNNVVTGNVGTDTVQYSAASSSYKISTSGNSSATIAAQSLSLDVAAHTVSSLPSISVTSVSDNTKSTLSSIERLQFSDKVVGFDVNGNAGEAYRIYEAAFNRKPDASGLGYWIAQLDKGATLKSVAEGFLGSSEFQKLYGSSPSNASFVDNLYKNILDRAGEKAGIDFWVGQLNSGVSRAEVLAGFSESSENKAGVIGSIQNGIEYKEWLG